MVHEPAAEEAVRIARRNPRLRVGLHLTLCAGPAERVSALTGRDGSFSESPARAGLRYFLSRSLRESLAEEIEAQFTRFREFGLPATYWDGHTHLHLHPTVFRLTLPIAVAHGFRAIRLVRVPCPRSILPLIFHALSRAAIPHLQKRGIRFADRTLGLRETGRMRMTTLSALLGTVSEGMTELYFHPGAEPEPLDFPALAQRAAAQGIVLGTSASAGS